MSGYLPPGCTHSQVDALCGDERPAHCDRCDSRENPDDCTLRAGELLCPRCVSADDDSSCGCATVDPETGRCLDCEQLVACVQLTSSAPSGPTACGCRVTPLRVTAEEARSPRAGVRVHPACLAVLVGGGL